jgi:hypothetical protein
MVTVIHVPLSLYHIISALILLVTGHEGTEKHEFFFRHINQWDGLLNNQVLPITQDSRGFIWIATVGGLQRLHRSHIINLNFVKRYIKGDGGLVEIQNGNYMDVKNEEFSKQPGINDASCQGQHESWIERNRAD